MPDPVALLSRWIHVISAIALLGGSVFMRFALLPSAKELPEAEHDALRAGVISRWKKFVHGGMVLLILSGFYNYLVAVPKSHKNGLYHALMGTKIILAFVVFFIAAALVGKSSGTQKIRDAAGKWAMIAVVLGIIIVLLAGFLKVRGPVPA